jgi:hypothetical protein
MAQDSLQKTNQHKSAGRRGKMRADPLVQTRRLSAPLRGLFPGRSPAPDDLGIISIPAVAHVPWAAA